MTYKAKVAVYSWGPHKTLSA